MKILGPTTMTDIIEDAFGEIDTDALMVDLRRKEVLGLFIVNTDHNKVESYYDRTHEWIVPFSRMLEEDDE